MKEKLFFGKQLGSPPEVGMPAKTADDLKHSLASPTERSKTKTKSESVSGLCGYVNFIFLLPLKISYY